MRDFIIWYGTLLVFGVLGIVIEKAELKAKRKKKYKQILSNLEAGRRCA